MYFRNYFSMTACLVLLLGACSVADAQSSAGASNQKPASQAPAVAARPPQILIIGLGHKTSSRSMSGRSRKSPAPFRCARMAKFPCRFLMMCKPLASPPCSLPATSAKG